MYKRISYSIIYISLFIVITAGSCVKTNTDKSELSIFELKCEHCINPLGIETLHPRLSWNIKSGLRNQGQTAYQVIVSSNLELLEKGNGDLWDSKKVHSDKSVHVKYCGNPIKSRQRCWWKARVWDKNNKPSAWSQPAYWEVGLLNPEDWKASWIGHDSEAAPMLRKEFIIDKQIKDAKVYISGLGYYELYINGSKVGDHVLDPAQTDYEKRTFYVTFDITKYLNPGENAVGAILGNGWYNQDVVNSDFFGWKDVVYGKPRLMAQIHIQYIDGSENIILSDETWKASTGPIIMNNIYLGEFYDARMEKKGWSIPGYNDSKWDYVKTLDGPGGKLVSQKLQAIKKTGTIKPVSISNPKSGVYVYNLGQNITGWVKIKMKSKRGNTIQLRFSESVFENGMIDPASTGVYATGVVQTDKYTFRSNEIENWEPRFTYHGFQYVELTGYQQDPNLESIEGIIVNTAVDNFGEFECSDTMINKIHNTIRRTVLNNFHGIITDCPHRERCQWLGDADIVSEMSFYNFDAYLLFAKFIRDIKTGAANGLPNAIAPGKRKSPASPDWGRAYIQIPYFLYLYFGDISIAQEHYNEMIGFMDHVKKKANNFIISEGWGDLFEPGSVKSKRTPTEITSTAFFYYDAKLLSKMAQALAKHNDSERFALLADNIKTAFVDDFYNQDDKTFGSQTANALALHFGLVPEGDEFAVATSMNNDILINFDGHHSTGHIGAKYIYGELSKYGYGETALAMLNKVTYPSFGDLFTKGATTLWEYWGEKEIDETSSGARSKSHPFQGGLDAWFFNGIAGINPDHKTPGFKHIVLKPQPIEGLTFAKAKFKSVYGTVLSDWKIKGNKFIWKISVPVNTKATVCIPNKFGHNILERNEPIKNLGGIKFMGPEKDYNVYSLGSGSYTFIVNDE